MNTAEETDPVGPIHPTVKEQVVDLYTDLAHEIEREVAEPHDSSQSDLLVQKHVTGVSISLFILISLFLLAVIAGIALYRHG
jgi:hypothetical protein